MYDKAETLERYRFQYEWQVNSLTLEKSKKEIETINGQIDALTGEGKLRA